MAARCGRVGRGGNSTGGRRRTGGERGAGRRRSPGPVRSPAATVTSRIRGSTSSNSEIEPWVTLNRGDGPDNDGILGDNLIGAWQQDRWNNGGSEGIVTRVELRRRADVDDQRDHEVVDLHRRDGGERRQLRAGLGSVGRLLAERDRLPDDACPSTRTRVASARSPNAMLVMRSTDGGATWEQSDHAQARREPQHPQRQEHAHRRPERLESSPTRSGIGWSRRPGETPNPNAFENAPALPRAGLVLAHDERRHELGDRRG